MANYIEKDRLKQIIDETQATGIIHEELCEVIINIAEGLIGKYKINKVEKEDAVQDCVLHTIKLVQRLDTNNNCFSYLTTCCFNVLRARIRQNKNYDTLKEKLKKNLKSSRKRS